MEIRVNKRFILGNKLGSGSYGDVYRSRNVITNQQAAIKLEVKKKHKRLFHEVEMYDELKGGHGIPSVRWHGTEGEYNVMVMDMLGDSLENLRHAKGGFSLKTVLMIGLQLLERIEYIHDHGILHRDIKPDNILIGTGAAARVIHLVDFGLAKRYRSDDHAHIPFRKREDGMTGTVRYASINAHLGEHSRRDDMESIGFVLVYLMRGRLPWQGTKASTKKRKYDQILDHKTTIPLTELCHGCPPEFPLYFAHCRGLGFKDDPDYAYLKGLLRTAMERESFTVDDAFDWVTSSQTATTKAR